MPIDRFPHYTQLDSMDCGPTCLRMIAKYYGRRYSLETLRDKAFITREGVSMLGISDAAESIGFRTSGVRITLRQLKEDVPLPCILHWNQNHFVVCYKIKDDRYYIADPAAGKVVYREAEFTPCWYSTKVNGEETGTALLLEPGPEFYEQEEEPEKRTRGLSYFFRYVKPYKREVGQLVLGMLTASILQLILPFLTQSLVDTGIQNSNLSFITLVLIAQLVIFVAKLSVDFIRSWILLHVNSRINIALISDFLAKLMRLPLHFFDTKMVGDIMQRIGDHSRIETFMTGSSINTLFSFVNFIVFGFVLAYYDLTILGLFLLGNGLYVAWVLAFMRYRRELDIKRFAQASSEQSNLGHGDAGDQAEQLRDREAVAMGAHPGKTVQDKHQGIGTGTVPAAGIGILQPDNEHSDFFHCRTGSSGRGHDIGYDDLADLYRGTAYFAHRTVHQLLAHVPGRENQSGTVGRNPSERGRGADVGHESEEPARRPYPAYRRGELQL